MIRSLAVLCALLLAVIAAEVLAHANVSQPVSSNQPRQTFTPRAPTGGAMETTDPQWLTEVLARPLFAPDRRPVAGAVASGPGLPRLAGIIGTPEGSFAIFQPDGDAKQVLAHPGERVGGWQVATIEAETVTLQKGGERIMLTPRFAPASATAVTPPHPIASLRR